MRLTGSKVSVARQPAIQPSTQKMSVWLWMNSNCELVPTRMDSSRAGRVRALLRGPAQTKETINMPAMPIRAPVKKAICISACLLSGRGWCEGADECCRADPASPGHPAEFAVVGVERQQVATILLIAD